MKNHHFRKCLSVLLSAFVMISLLIPAAAEEEETPVPEATTNEEAAVISEEEPLMPQADAGIMASTSTAVIKATYYQNEARRQLSMINDLRTGSNAWVWNSSDTEKIWYRNLNSLYYDYDLEKAAMQRAAEVALEWGHYRPDGSYCVTAYPSAFDNTWRGECIAIGTGSAESAFAIWLEEYDSYSGQAHRRNMLSPNFRAVGIGFAVVSGRSVFVQEFSSAYVNSTPVSYNEKPRNVSITMLSERGSFSGSFSKKELNDKPRMTVEIGYPVNVPGVKTEFLYRGSQYDVSVGTTVKSSNTGVLRIENNQMIGVSPGTSTVTIEKTCGSYSFTKKLKVTVREHVHDYQFTWQWADDYSAASADYVCSVDAAHAGHGDAQITQETTEPLCYEDGITVYTASLEIDGEIYTNDRYIRLPKTDDHHYEAPVYEWSDDLTSVTASAFCESGQETLSETVNTVYEVVKQPTSAEGGTGRRIAYFTNELFETQSLETEIPPKDANAPTSFAIREDTKNIVYGQSAKLTPEISPQGASAEIFWASSNPEVASVDPNGNVTGNKAGTAVIRGYTLYGHFDECEVNVLFSDVTNAKKYYYDPVYWAATNQITTGTTPSTFTPDNNCTREQIVTFLWRMMGSPDPQSYVSFTDVKPDRYFFKAISWAYENGITTGVNENEFGVGKPCTREMAVTFLYRAAGEPYVSSYKYFYDVSSEKYYYWPIRWAAGTGITTGVSTYYFGVGEPCTRGMIVTFMSRFMNGTF